MAAITEEQANKMQADLEVMIDGSSVSDVLYTLVEVCMAKSCHLVAIENGQFGSRSHSMEFYGFLAIAWERAGQRIENAIRKLPHVPGIASEE